MILFYIVFVFSTKGFSEEVFRSSATWGVNPGPVKSARASLYTTYEYGDPTGDEQAHLEEINRARLNPSGEASRFNIDLNEGPPEEYISSLPVQPLTMNKRLLAVARAHSQDMLDQDYFEHDSPDLKTPYDRITESGYIHSSAGENLAFKGFTYKVNATDQILDMHGLLFVDDDYDGRGHRINMLLEHYREVGVGVAFGEYYSDGISYDNSFMLTCDFASASTTADSFVLGVVYNDNNNDGLYTSGEGAGGVEITINTDYAETRSASAGGYGIPLPDGDYTIQVTLADESVYEKSFTINGENIKIDFRLNGLAGNAGTNDSVCFIQSCF
jgi:hypothetical protein